MGYQVFDGGSSAAMRQKRDRLIALHVPIACLATVAAGVGLLSLTSNDVHGAEGFATSGFLTGFAHRGKGGKQTYKILTHVAYAPDPGLPGGIAAFGIRDGGAVMLLTHTAYVPSLVPAGSTRELMTTKPPLDLPQLPRFIMVCAWPLDGEAAGESVAGYAELDEANVSVIPGKYSVGLAATWVSIPAERAPAAFNQRDFCGEIASTGKTSAPWWMLDRRR